MFSVYYVRSHPTSSVLILKVWASVTCSVNVSAHYFGERVEISFVGLAGALLRLRKASQSGESLNWSTLCPYCIGQFEPVTRKTSLWQRMLELHWSTIMGVVDLSQRSQTSACSVVCGGERSKQEATGLACMHASDDDASGCNGNGWIRIPTARLLRLRSYFRLTPSRNSSILVLSGPGLHISFGAAMSPARAAWWIVH